MGLPHNKPTADEIVELPRRVKGRAEIICARHLAQNFRPENVTHTILRLSEIIRANRIQSDFIAVRGVSGCTMGACLAWHLQKHLVVVRKPRESSHSRFLVEGIRPDYGKFIILDDMISSGQTVAETYSAVMEKNPTAKCSAILLYFCGEVGRNSHRVDRLTEIPIYSLRVEEKFRS